MDELQRRFFLELFPEIVKSESENDYYRFISVSGLYPAPDMKTIFALGKDINRSEIFRRDNHGGDRLARMLGMLFAPED